MGCLFLKLLVTVEPSVINKDQAYLGIDRSKVCNPELSVAGNFLIFLVSRYFLLLTGLYMLEHISPFRGKSFRYITGFIFIFSFCHADNFQH